MSSTLRSATNGLLPFDDSRVVPRVTSRTAGSVSVTRELLDLLTRHRELTLEMARREIADRYARQLLGPTWAIVHPVLLIAIYVFLFAVVFRMRLGGTADMPRDYTSYLLAGLIPWLGIQDALIKSTTALSANANLVKQVVFPIEVLPIKTVLASMLTVGISLSVLVIYGLVKYHGIPWTYVLLPALLVLQLVLSSGLSYLLSAVGAYVRDTKDVVQVALVVTQYLLPIFYLPTLVPPQFRPILYLNPFSYLVWCYQDALYFGRMEHAFAWGVAPVIAVGSFYVGYRLFHTVKSTFGNVL